MHLKKKNNIAFMVSNESLTALNWFPIARGLSYNDVLRWLYDALYEITSVIFFRPMLRICLIIR